MWSSDRDVNTYNTLDVIISPKIKAMQAAVIDKKEREKQAGGIQTGREPSTFQNPQMHTLGIVADLYMPQINKINTGIIELK